MVLCHRVFDYESGTVYEIRTDTGEYVESCKMIQSELQMEFDLFEKNKGAAKIRTASQHSVMRFALGGRMLI